MGSSSSSVSVVIPVHNGGAAFQRCLCSLAQSTRPPRELIVVADGDTDGSRNLAKSFGAHVLVNDTPQGPARARNRGARAASGDFLFFVDADVAVRPQSIAQVERNFEREPDLDALIGSYDDTPAVPNFLSQYRNLLHHYTHQRGREDASTFWGACGAVRRDVFLSMGGFDEQYGRPCIEDVEFGYRLKHAGHRIKLAKNLQVKHLKQWTTYSMLETDVFARALPWTMLLLQRRMLPDDLNTDTTGRLSTGAVFALLAALLGAFWWPPLLFAAGLAATMLLLLNAPLYTFFYRKRGLGFAVQAVPWHWLYFVYSGGAFAAGLLRHLLRAGRAYLRVR